ncbi:MAG: FCD domain-containing protein [Phenylobacterium sp.]|uniref:GntR family transcriptional regulator n=1 Tax=Phenylobacterium sp. TaxID=1871053 RepID=UPI0012016D71|nr:GntR family transcriptional regulator [Phenylobacterium sp.]TAJ72162.1 MAG: FCD domain-containing protein [Phenylobacterium sp.]
MSREGPVSVSRFTDPLVTSPADPARHPSQATAYWLRRDIIRGVFQPRDRLKVEPLSQFYGVGQSPVREAILMLSTSGLLAHEHLKGYRVADVSLADYRDLLDIYQRIYRLALNMAFERGDDAWEEQVVVQLHRSLRVHKVLPDGDPERREMWQMAYIGLHRALLDGCGSPILLDQFSALGGRLERYVNLFGDLESDRDRDHHAEHRAIVDALMDRNAKRLHALVDRFFVTTQPVHDSIKAALRDLETKDGA